MLNNIFGALMGGTPQGGAQPQANNPAQGGEDLLSGVLGSLMGGQGGGNMPVQAATNQSQGGADLVSGLLGSFMGSQTGATGSQIGSNPVMNLVNSGQNPMVNALIGPVVDQIAMKLGIPPAMAMTVVTFAVHYMLSNHGTKLVNGEDMSGVLQQHTDQNFLHSTGMTKELASQTGMKPAAAANALSEVFKMLGAA